LMVPDELLQDLIGLGTHHSVVVDHKGWNGCYPHLTGTRPISIDSLLERSRGKDSPCLILRKTDQSGQIRQHVNLANISTIHKIRPKNRIVKFLAPASRFSPLGQLLGKTAIECPRPFTERKSKLIRCLPKTQFHSLYVHAAAGIQLIQRKAFFRGFWMKGKSSPSGLNLIILPQLVNTDRTEIAPRSDVVRKNFKGDWFVHEPSPPRLLYLLAALFDGKQYFFTFYSDLSPHHSVLSLWVPNRLRKNDSLIRPKLHGL